MLDGTPDRRRLTIQEWDGKVLVKREVLTTFAGVYDWFSIAAEVITAEELKALLHPKDMFHRFHAGQVPVVQGKNCVDPRTK